MCPLWHIASISRFHYSTSAFGTKRRCPDYGCADNKFLGASSKNRGELRHRLSMLSRLPHGAHAEPPSLPASPIFNQRIGLSNGINSHDYLDAFWQYLHAACRSYKELLEIGNAFFMRDSGEPDAIVPDAQQWDVGALPDEALMLIVWAAAIATRKNYPDLGVVAIRRHQWRLAARPSDLRLRPQPRCVGSVVAPIPTVPPRRVMPSASAYPGTLPISL